MITYQLTRTWPDQHMQQLAVWTARMMAAAEPSAKDLGCSPEAIVAQAALESNWGAASIGNNVFGVKADSSWTGKRRLVWTPEDVDDGNGGKVRRMFQLWFRDYDSEADSFADHLKILHQKNFVDAGVFDPNDTKSDHEYFEALKQGRYATAVDYVDALDQMLKSVKIFTPYMVRADNGVPMTPLPPRLLMNGCAGPDVAALQQKLRLHEVDGAFGANTRDAVMHFQGANHLTVDGIVGTQTRTSLGL